MGYVTSSTVKVGDEAPDFTLNAVIGAPVTLSALRGAPVVLIFLRGFFWPNCRRHLSQLRDEFERIDATGATVLAIAPSSGAKADEYIAKSGDFPFALLSDSDHTVFDAYDVGSKMMSLGQRPAMFVLDTAGKVTYNQVGKQQIDLPTVDEILGELTALGA